MHLLVFCVLWFALLLEDKAVNLLPTLYPADVLPKNLKWDPEFYETGDGKKCKLCPPGSFVFKPCTVSGTEGVCHPCENGTYYGSRNEHGSCHRCKVCRTLDEVEIKPCTTSTNTECACKNGTFCSPEHPCETCHKCLPSCPPGKEKVQDCTPKSDLQCRLISATPSPPTGANEDSTIGPVIGGVFGSLAILVVAATLIGCWKKTRSCRNSRTTLWSSKTIRFLPCLQPSNSEGHQGEQDNRWNTDIDKESLQPLQIFTASDPEAPGEKLVPTAPPLEGRTKMKSTAEGLEFRAEKSLVPANGKTSEEVLSQSFDTFIETVPGKEWSKYMRALGLKDNEIDSAVGNYPNEKKYDMLRTWRDKKGKAASVNDLLKELFGIGYRGVAEDIQSKLVTKGLYVYEK